MPQCCLGPQPSALSLAGVRQYAVGVDLDPAYDAHVTQVAGAKAAALVASGIRVLDVRTPEEFAEGHVPGAVNIPISDLEARLGDVPKDRTVIVYCESGRRAGRAEKLLAGSGRDVRHLEGDMAAWRKAQLEIER